MFAKRLTALALSVALVAATIPAGAQAVGQDQPQGQGLVAGTAKDEAKKPFETNTVRARGLDGSVSATVPLDAEANYSISGLTAQPWVLELLDAKGKILCTEHVTLTAAALVQSDVEIDCGKKALLPIALIALGAGLTAGLLASATQ